MKARRAPSRHCRGVSVYGHTTTAMHDLSTRHLCLPVVVMFFAYTTGWGQNQFRVGYLWGPNLERQGRGAQPRPVSYQGDPAVDVSRVGLLNVVSALLYREQGQHAVLYLVYCKSVAIILPGARFFFSSNFWRF